MGAMTGWWLLLDGHDRQGRAERAYGTWMRLGRHELVALDHRTSSPAVIGRAILERDRASGPSGRGSCA